MSTLSVTLSDELSRFVENSVQTGHFHSPSELIAVAVTNLRTEESVRRAKLEMLRREIGTGIAQADADEFEQFDAEQIIAEGQARRAAELKP